MTFKFTVTDDFFVNEDFERLKPIIARDERYLALVTANVIPLDFQEWFFKAIKQSGLFEIFDVFPVTDEQIRITKAMIEYDNNPTLENLGVMLEFVFGLGVTIQNLQGEVILGIPSANFSYPRTFTNDGMDTNNRTFTDDGILFEPRTFTLPPELVIAEENLFFIQHFIPAGTLLTITFI